jgi:hypothetical protein
MHTLARLTPLLALAACSQSHTVVGPDGEVGVCCPIADFSGCSPGAEPRPGGGYARSTSECDYTIEGFDGFPYERGTDAFGCPILREDTSGCCGCVPVEDAGVPGECAGLAPAACLSRIDCAPAFDDACCPHCSPGECADCTNIEYEGCVALNESACRGGTECGEVPAWGCGPAAPNCEGASVIDLDSCTAAGCVPAYPSGEGEPNILYADCRPIRAGSCTASCDIPAPPCPTGMVPEADGDCYTSLCIPAFVCG